MDGGAGHLVRHARPTRHAASGAAPSAVLPACVLWALWPDRRGRLLRLHGCGLPSAPLWYRLLPNPTNPIGVIPGLILAVGPFFGLGAWALSRRMHRLDGWQALGLGGALAGVF